MFSRISFFVSIFFLTALSLTFAADANSEARALFAGAKQRLQKYECFRVCYTETRGETNQTVSQIVDYDHGRMRKEHLQNNDGFPGWVAVLNEGDFCSLRLVPHEDAKLDSPKSENAKMSGLYDPRILMLGDIPIYKFTVGNRIPSTLGTLNAQIENIMVDYRIQQRLGYWNGEELVERPAAISAQEHREVMKQMEEDAAKRKWLSIGGLIGIGIGAVLVLGAIYLMIRERRKP